MVPQGGPARETGDSQHRRTRCCRISWPQGDRLVEPVTGGNPSSLLRGSSAARETGSCIDRPDKDTKKTPQPWRRPKLARVLRVSLDELDELLNPERPRTATAAGGFQQLASRREVIVDAALFTGADVADHVASRRPKESSRLGTNCQTPSPPSVRSASRQVVELHRAYQAARYAEVGRRLPSVTATVHELVSERTARTSRNVLGVQCSLHIAAAKLATKAGNHADAWTAAEQARSAAEAAEDTFGQAAAAYQRTCALLRAGDGDQAEQVAVSAADTMRSRDRHGAP